MYTTAVVPEHMHCSKFLDVVPLLLLLLHHPC
jgi:hypothetical protein